MHVVNRESYNTNRNVRVINVQYIEFSPSASDRG